MTDTTSFKSSFLKEAAQRGFIFQCTDFAELDRLMADHSISAYIGFDPTARSLHVGSLVQIMLLRLLQKHGHKPVVLMGGGTARIGDPSFRDEMRSFMSEETIQTNIAGIKKCLSQFLNFGDQQNDVLLLNNAQWLDKLSYIQLLRDVGPHFSINRMLSFDSVKLRLQREQGLTFLEFNYSILQSYDFRELLRHYGVCLQLGGSDQWGNIVSGVDLIRRTDQKTVMGLTTPLLQTASGAKMGKTARGAVWLSDAFLSPFDYWQFWRNTEDADVGRFLKLFTELDVEECQRLGALKGADINQAKIILATQATTICHGKEAALAAQKAASETFQKGQINAADLPTYHIDRTLLEKGMPAHSLFKQVGLAQSGGQARRLIRGGGAYINNQPIRDENKSITLADLHDGAMTISSGKKKHILVKPKSD